MILIDSREVESSFRSKVAEMEHEVRPLDGGDYWIQKEGGWIVVEKMTMTDFIEKLKSGRLWAQADKCTSLSDDVYFLIEGGNQYKQYSKMSPASIIAAQASLSRRLKVFRVMDSRESFAFFKYLYDKFHLHQDKAVLPRLKPKKMKPVDAAIWFMTGLDGVGSVRASEIIAGANVYDFIDYVRTGFGYMPGWVEKRREQYDLIFQAKSQDKTV